MTFGRVESLYNFLNDSVTINKRSHIISRLTSAVSWTLVERSNGQKDVQKEANLQIRRFFRGVDVFATYCNPFKCIGNFAVQK